MKNILKIFIGIVSAIIIVGIMFILLIAFVAFMSKIISPTITHYIATTIIPVIIIIMLVVGIIAFGLNISKKL
jgi:hypothetical protein